jgi:MFS family permease
VVSPAETVKAKSHWKPQFSLLLFGLLLSKLGTSIYMLSLPWLAYDLTGSSLILGSVFAVEMLPYILLMPFGGVLIDKMSRKKIMIVSDVLRCIVLLSVPVLFGVGLLEVSYVYLLSFSMSVLSFMVEVSFDGDRSNHGPL